MPHDPLSVASGLVYLVPALIAFLMGEPTVALAFLILTLGTCLWHWTRDEDVPLQLDRLGMLATLMTLAAWQWDEWLGIAALALACGLLWFYSYPLIVILIVIISAIVLVTGGSWLLLVGALAAIGLAYWAHERPGDAWHATWQLLAGVAYVLIEFAF